MILVENIKKARGKDKKIIKVVEKMKKTRVKALREDEWEIEGELHCGNLSYAKST